MTYAWEDPPCTGGHVFRFVSSISDPQFPEDLWCDCGAITYGEARRKKKKRKTGLTSTTWGV